MLRVEVPDVDVVVETRVVEPEVSVVVVSKSLSVELPDVEVVVETKVVVPLL